MKRVALKIKITNKKSNIEYRKITKQELLEMYTEKERFVKKKQEELIEEIEELSKKKRVILKIKRNNKN